MGNQSVPSCAILISGEEETVKKSLFTLTILISSVLYLWTGLATGNPFPEQPTVRLGKGNLEGAAYSPDGKMLAVAGSLGVWLYDADDLTEVGILEQPHPANCVEFSPDGRTLAVGGTQTLYLWNVERQQEIDVLHTESVHALAFSPDGKLLAAGDWRGMTHLWNIETQKQIVTLLEGYKSEVTSLVFSADGKTLASSGKTTINLWDVDTQQRLTVLDAHTSFVSSLALHPDGNTLASGSRDKTVRLWDIKEQKQLTVLEIPGSVRSVAFSPDGKKLAAGEWRTVHLWDIETQEQIAAIEGHTSWVRFVAFNPTGKHLASAGGLGNQVLRLWEVETQKPLAVLKDHTSSAWFLDFYPDGKILVSSNNGEFLIWDVDAQKQIGSLEGWLPLALSPNGKILAFRGKNRDIQLWDIDTQKQVAVLEGHTDWVSSFAFSPDGKILASVGKNQDNTIRLWDVEAQKQVATLGEHEGSFARLTFSADGKTLASAGERGIYLWNIQQRKLIARLTTEEVFRIAFSPNGKFLASVGANLQLWDIQQQKQVGQLWGKTQSIAFSPDGNFLASVHSNYGNWRVRLWDVRAQKQVGTLPEEVGRYGIFAIAFSPDGKWLASSGSDGTTLLWEVNLPAPLTVEPKGKQAITLGGLKHTMLLQNFPNPFNPETWIPYHLTEGASIAIQIYDAQGTPVRKLDLGQKSAGTYLAREAAAYWDGRNDYGELLSSGLYFYQLRAAEFSATRRMILAK